MAGVMRLVVLQLRHTKNNPEPLKALTEFVKNPGKPLLVSPCAWREEDGLSHHGYILDGLKLKQLALLDGDETPPLTVIEIKDASPASIDAGLLSVGLRINSLAE